MVCSGHTGKINGLEYIELGVPDKGRQHDLLLLSYAADCNGDPLPSSPVSALSLYSACVAYS